MKISGFTFLRDGVRFGYPFEASIRSALPVCDEFIVAVGDSDDGTLERLQQMNEPKLRLIPTTWNEHIRAFGFAYAQQKMIAQFNCTGDWAFYLECDEVLHENDVSTLRGALEHYLEARDIEVLAFDYHHFWGDAHHVRDTSQVYRKAARIIRNDIRSFAPDGLYWAVFKDRNWLGRRNKRRSRYPRAAALNIPLYHYGNARAERFLKEKAATANRYWSKSYFHSAYSNVDPRQIVSFRGTHPALMREWLEESANPAFEFDPAHRLTRRERKHRFLRRLEKAFDCDLSKRHFRIVESYDERVSPSRTP